MKNLNYQLEVNKKGQVTIPKTLRDILDIQEESFINVIYNKDTEKIEIDKADSKFSEFKVNILKSNLLNNLPMDKKPVLFISGSAGSGKTTLVKEIVRGLSIDGLAGKVKEHKFTDEGEIFIVDDIYDDSPDYTKQDKINDSKPTIITSQKRIESQDINEEVDRLYIYIYLNKNERDIQSIYLSQNKKIIQWEW